MIELHHVPVARVEIPKCPRCLESHGPIEARAMPRPFRDSRGYVIATHRVECPNEKGPVLLLVKVQVEKAFEEEGEATDED